MNVRETKWLLPLLAARLLVAKWEHLQQQYGPAGHQGKSQDVKDALKVLQVEGLSETVFSKDFSGVTASAVVAASVTECGQLLLVNNASVRKDMRNVYHTHSLHCIGTAGILKYHRLSCCLSRRFCYTKSTFQEDSMPRAMKYVKLTFIVAGGK